MQWNDSAIILSVSKFSEHGAVVRMLSREHGLYSGICKSAFSKSKRGIYQIGNEVDATWKARLETHMGSFECELSKPVAALLMMDQKALSGLNAACSMIPLAMEERDPHPALYDALIELIEVMMSGEDWLAHYVKFELDLLREAGYGLDFTQCAATGTRDALTYVSPKSGCAVSADAGKPYHDRMLSLPAFLIQETVADMEQIKQAFRLTSHFLHHWLLAPLGRNIPAARERLVSSVI